MIAGADEYFLVRGNRMHVIRWSGHGTPFVLVHGLASNAHTWDGVARALSAAGHPVVAVDQRGHGLSDKPERGYGFAEVSNDLEALIGQLGLVEPPIVAGQSWGGNVVLDFAVRSPRVARGIVLVDGGFIELSARPGATWEQVAQDLRPPPLAGTPRAQVERRLREAHPDWSDEGIEGSLANFETLPDGTARPWLTLERHMQILEALWHHHPSQLYGRLKTPVVFAAARRSGDAGNARKQDALALAQAELPGARVVWFDETDHDIHVQRPGALAALMLDALLEGRFDA